MRQTSPARGAGGQESSAHTGGPDRGPRYGLLLLVLLVAYVLSTFSSGRLNGSLESGLFVIALALAVRRSALPRRWQVIGTAVVLAGSAAALGLLLASTGIGAGIANVWLALVLVVAAAVIVRRVLARPTVTIQSIYGALSAYLVVGLMFAEIYAAIGHLSGSAFFANGQPTNTQTVQYFSFTTLTTLGYGDFTAAGNTGRAIAVLEALTGQVFLATLVARLVAAFRAPAGRDGPATTRRRPHNGIPDDAGMGRRRPVRRAAKKP
jgi:Ion channel